MNGTEPQGVDNGVQPEAEGPDRPSGKSREGWWKVAVVLIVLAAVAVTVLLKSSKGRREKEAASGLQVPVFGPSEVLAAVNGEPITLAQLQSEFQGLPEEYRSEYGSRMYELLEDMIVRKLLLREAEGLKIEESAAYKKAVGDLGPGQEEEVLLNVLIQTQVLDKVEINEEELRDFYEQREAANPSGQDFEAVKELVRVELLQQKQEEAIKKHISELKQKANVTRNQEWIRAERTRSADNPLDRALLTGRPVVADFGRGKCIPCKMMKPILEKLAKKYKGRAEILIIDIDDFPDVARRCRVRLIPVQVFYDVSGNETYRHVGFMPETDIREQLAKLGVE